VNSNSARCLFTELKEASQDVLRRVRAIEKVELGVVDALSGESPRVVILLVEAHHQSDVLLLEVRDVVFRSQGEVTFHGLFGSMWTGEGEELSLHTPVQIAILDLKRERRGEVRQRDRERNRETERDRDRERNREG
jgi:hypothetical protein